MIADWMGAGRAYVGSWDIRDWLDDNLPRMALNPETREFIIKIQKEKNRDPEESD